MDANFLAFITSEYNRGFVGGKRQNFLLTLRDKPENVVRWVGSNLMNWGNLYLLTGAEIVFSYDNDGDAHIVVDHFKQYFASEIQALPAPAMAQTSQSV
ncbi:MAG: hypothetical protein Q7R65_02560 [bacterium]|nr:hypothetical protein [bacterium]